MIKSMIAKMISGTVNGIVYGIAANFGLSGGPINDLKNKDEVIKKDKSNQNK